MLRAEAERHILRGIGKTSNLSDLIKQKSFTKPIEQLTTKKEEPIVDRTLLDNGYWERATFTVPSDIPHERVVFAADKYKARFGKALTIQGFKVSQMLEPAVTDRLPEEGRRRYDILAFVSRKPMTLHMDVPDFAVPAMEKTGLKLNE